ncbi:arf-GAP with Rho-GAP domain, ANK repeat and PH domain-containing protein 1-like, partial [Saccoglossus kowalevskii]
MKKLIGHLKSVSECSKENRMVIENLAAVWGPTLLSSGDTFKDTNHEIVVIGDIIRYYDWLFGISDEEKKKKLAIEEARKKMEELHMNRQQIPDMMFSVNLYEFDGTSVNVKVNGTTTSDMCIKQLLNNTKLGIEPCTNYALFELLFKGSVVRPIHGSEKILDIYTKWGEKGKNNQVCLKENHVVDMCKASSSTAYGMVRISDKRAFKKLYLELTGRLLRLYKDSKSSSRHESELSLDQLFIYIGIDPNKATPTNYGLTFRDKNDVKANFRYICCESEYDYRRWIGGLFNAKYPDGFSCNRDISTATQSPVDGMYEYVSSGACKPAVI